MLLIRRTTVLIVALLTALLALAAVSCDSSTPTEPEATAATTVDAVSLTAKADRAAAAAGMIVNGHGTVWVPEPHNAWMNISFHAHQNADGSVHGSWHHQFRSRTPGGRIKVHITCLGVDGTEAWLAGYAVQAGSDANLGKWFGLHVIDHGDGHGVIDEMSRSLWFGFDAQRAADFCTEMPTEHAVWPLAAGNVQVH